MLTIRGMVNITELFEDLNSYIKCIRLTTSGYIYKQLF